MSADDQRDDREPDILDPDDRSDAADSGPGRTPKRQPTDQTTVLTIPEVAASCQISQTSVRRAIAEGELQAVKLRSRIRIRREAFDAWHAEQQRPATRPRARPAPPRPKTKKPPRVFPPPGSFRELSRRGPEPGRRLRTMSIERLERKNGHVYRVRRHDEHGQAHSRVVGRKRDAKILDSELKRAKRLGARRASSTTTSARSRPVPRTTTPAAASRPGPGWAGGSTR